MSEYCNHCRCPDGECCHCGGPNGHKWDDALSKSDEERTAEAQAWLDHVNSFPKDSSCRGSTP